jgi:hypothetical protein
LVALNTVVLDGMVKGRQASPLFVAVTNFGVVAATVLLGGTAVLVPELVPLVEPPPLDDAVEAPLEAVPFGGVVVPPLEVVPFGGVVVPAPEVVPFGGVVVPSLEVVPFGGVVALPEVLLVGVVVVPEAGVSAVEPPELAALLEPQALSAARHTIEIAGKNATRSFDAKIIVTCFHSLSSNHAECR